MDKGKSNGVVISPVLPDNTGIIITMPMPPDGKKSVFINSAKMWVFVRDGNSYKRVGLIGKMKLKATAKIPQVKFIMKFPPPEILINPDIKENLENQVKLLSRYGVKVKHYSKKAYK